MLIEDIRDEWSLLNVPVGGGSSDMGPTYARVYRGKGLAGMIWVECKCMVYSRRVVSGNGLGGSLGKLQGG